MSGTLVVGNRAAGSPAALMREGARTVRAFVRVVSAWHQRRRRAAADREALANMSDRELSDIGIPRGSVDAAANQAWLRDGAY